MVTAGSVVAQAIGAERHAPELCAQQKCTLKTKAKCKTATVSTQKLGKQNLSGSNLSGAVITGSTFTDTNLRNVDLTNAKLTNGTFKNTDLGGVTLTGASLVNVRFDHVDASVGSSGRACEMISGFKVANYLDSLPTKTVTAAMTHIPQGSSPEPSIVNSLSIEQVAAAGVVVATKTCTSANTSTTDVPLGSWGSLLRELR